MMRIREKKSIYWIISTVIALYIIIGSFGTIISMIYLLITLKGDIGNIDYLIYRWAFQRYKDGSLYYGDTGDYGRIGFAYFPSFFIYFQFIYSFEIYIYFLLICIAISCALLLVINKSDNERIVAVALIVGSFNFSGGNIDPFILLIISICLLFRNNKYLPPILLGLISFKPTMIIVLPYFLWKYKSKLFFCLLFISAFLCINYYAEPNLSRYFDWWHYATIGYSNRIDYLRPMYIWYIYYFWFKELDGKHKSIYQSNIKNLIKK